MDPLLVLAGLSAVAGVGIVALGARSLFVERRQADAAAYLDDLRTDRDLDLAGPEGLPSRFDLPFVERVVRPVLSRVAGLVGAIAPSDHRTRIRVQLARAGLDTEVRPEELIALQGVGAAVGLVLGFAVVLLGVVGPTSGVVLLGLLVGLGTFLPQAWLNRQVDRRLARIRADLPETFDLLAISVEAGLGLEGAMEVVVDRSSGPLADELSRTLQEMGLGLSRHDALVNLKRRSQVPELSSFVQALVQADALGMPLGRVLKVQAGEMRSRRRQWARERAAKLPVKILFPLVACIFPAILVVVLGPAMSQIGDAF